MNNYKKISIILVGLLLITSCGEKSDSPPHTKSEAQSQNKLDGVDIKAVIENALLDIKATYIAPEPTTIKKAFEPCKLEGEGGNLKGDCQLSSNGKFLVGENEKNNKDVSISASGARTMVSQVLFSASSPNNISNAFSEINDWNIKEIDCGQDKDIGDHRHIYTAKPKGKQTFVFETAEEGGSGGSFGKLLVHLTPVTNSKPCELVDINLYMLEDSLADTSDHSINLTDSVPTNLTYDSVVTLRGKLISALGEGNDEKMHNYPALQLEKPLSVLGTDELNVSEQDVVLIQLSLNDTLFKQYEKLNGNNVLVTGTLFHSDNGNHYTHVLMDTSAIKNTGVNSAVSNLNVDKKTIENKQQHQTNTLNKSKNYQQLFICATDMNHLPVAKTLATSLISYYSAGQDMAYTSLLNSPTSKISGSTLGDGCVQHGFKVDKLPEGNKVMYSENDKMLFWIIETKGLAGGAYTAVAEYK